MSKETIDLMWERLAQHQPFADELGYGPEWKHMCNTRAEEDAWVAAAWAADAAWWAAKAEAAWAARAANEAKAEAEWLAANAECWAERAIKYIEKAEGRDEND
jgi:hypothetical protein